MARNPKINQREIDKQIKALAKGYERAARKHPIRVPLATEVSAGSPRTVGIESDSRLARLLMWLDAQAAINPAHYVDVTRYTEAEQLSPEEAVNLARQLEQQGLANVAWGLGQSPDVHLADEGHLEVRRLKALQQDRAARLRYTLDALLHWVFTAGHDQTPVDPAGFLVAPGAYFAGAALSGDDVAHALGQLVQHQLLDRIDTDPETVTLTTEGINCALSGGSVSDHINRPRPGDNITFHIGENTGNIAANSRDFTMNATTTKDGIDPAAVVMLARALRQAAPVLELPEEDAIEFTQLATRLETEAATGAPDPSRLQRWGASVVGILNSPVVSGALGSVLAAYTGTVLPGLPSS